MEIIEIVVKDKHAQNPSGCIVCDNSDYAIKFIFDDEWSAYTYKTARFVYNGTVVEKVFSGNTVNVPAIRSPGILSVGAFTDDLATTPAEIRCCPSIVSKTGKTPDPEGDVYDQVITLLNTLDVNKVSEEVAKAYEMLNVVSNAVTGTASGSAVRVDDVSPIEHTVGCKVRSKNLFNTLDDYKGYGHTYADGTLTITGQYTNKYVSLEDGKTYTFSCQSTRTGTTGGGAFLRAYTEDKSTYVNLGSAISTLSPILTATLPKGYPFLRITFYGYYSTDDADAGDATYTEIMLEEGSEATGYVPYVDVTTAILTRCGENLLPYPYSTTGFNGTYVTLTVNAYRSVTVKGTPPSATQIDLATDLKLPAGDYCIAGNGSNVRVRILGVDGASRYSVNTFTLAEGESVRVYVVALENEEIDYTFYPMLNVGTEALPYEDYIGETYAPDADGNVDGVTSLSPTMTLLTDTANVVIEAEYNRDINKVIANLEAKIT